jgi:hypothetical protein
VYFGVNLYKLDRAKKECVENEKVIVELDRYGRGRDGQARDRNHGGHERGERGVPGFRRGGGRGGYSGRGKFRGGYYGRGCRRGGKGRGEDVPNFSDRDSFPILDVEPRKYMVSSCGPSSPQLAKAALGDSRENFRYDSRPNSSIVKGCTRMNSYELIPPKTEGLSAVDKSTNESSRLDNSQVDVNHVESDSVRKYWKYDDAVDKLLKEWTNLYA